MIVELAVHYLSSRRADCDAELLVERTLRDIHLGRGLFD